MRRIVQIATVLIIVLIYSPIIASSNKVTPFLFGMPYILWSSILATIALLIVLFIAYKVELGKNNSKEIKNG